MDSIQYMYSEKGNILFIKNKIKLCFHKELSNNIEQCKCIQEQCKACMKIGKNTKLVTIEFS
jgi:hypothetical protein